jgi:ribonuclease D
MAIPLLSPKAGLPKLIESTSEFERALEEISSGKGPIALDAERASGFKYSARAYLIQAHRRDGGLHLIDPISVGSTHLWEEFNSAFSNEEWILHASTQDLPCLNELGLKPKILFDTELGGRIAGCERVGLGSLCENLLELQLAKEHSAVDWSTRPLKTEWLNYAALDVDVLIDLRDAVEKLLEEKGKLEWAKEEFAHILTLPTSTERVDPWRRTSGMHKVRDRRALNAIKNLWHARDAYAEDVDVAPGRIFNDETMMELINKRPGNVADFAKILMKRTRYQNLPAESWFSIYESAFAAADNELPPMRGSGTGLPAIKIWEGKNPLGYARATHVRAKVNELAVEYGMPPENLVSPDVIKKLCWNEPPSSDLPSYIESTLLNAGARAWQVGLIAGHLEAGLLEQTPLKIAQPVTEEGISQQ